MMTFKLDFGFWLLPTLFTTVCWAWAIWAFDTKPAHDYGRIGKAFSNLMIAGVALIATLVGWLVYVVAVLIFSSRQVLDVVAP